MRLLGHNRAGNWQHSASASALDCLETRSTCPDVRVQGCSAATTSHVEAINSQIYTYNPQTRPYISNSHQDFSYHTHTTKAAMLTPYRMPLCVLLRERAKV